MKELVVIAIIAHKEFLTVNEKNSLSQVYNILAKYPIVLICPKGLNVTEYKKIKHEAQIHFIDSKWQSDYDMFNRLKKASLLYNFFKNYKYILFYELDAWVFKDELSLWCNKGYDYLGAPWFRGYNIPDSDNHIIGVGNGGFSLRNVATSLYITKRLAFLKPLRSFWFKSHIQAVIRFSTILSLLKSIFKIDNLESLNQALVQNDLLEDYYWSQVISKAFSDYKVASITDAIKFSFEVNPAYLYKLNNMQLPFGCHAWILYEPEFWKQFITA